MSKPACQAVLSGMQLSLHATCRAPHDASRFVHATSAWSMKTRRSPPRHCWDAGVDGHTPAAVPDISTPPPLPTKRFPADIPLNAFFHVARVFLRSALGGRAHASGGLVLSRRVTVLERFGDGDSCPGPRHSEAVPFGDGMGEGVSRAGDCS